MARTPTVGRPGHSSPCAVYQCPVYPINVNPVMYCRQTFPTEVNNNESGIMWHVEHRSHLQTADGLSTGRSIHIPVRIYYTVVHMVLGRFPILIYFCIVCNHATLWYIPVWLGILI